MSSKSGPQTHNARRSQLTLTKQNNQQQTQYANYQKLPSQNASANLNTKNDKTLHQKLGQSTSSDAKVCIIKTTQKQMNMEKKVQPDLIESARKFEATEEKRTQIAVAKNNGNVKEKEQNGTEQNGKNQDSDSTVKKQELPTQPEMNVEIKENITDGAGNKKPDSNPSSKIPKANGEKTMKQLTIKLSKDAVNMKVSDIKALLDNGTKNIQSNEDLKNNVTVEDQISVAPPNVAVAVNVSAIPIGQAPEKIPAKQEKSADTYCTQKRTAMNSSCGITNIEKAIGGPSAIRDLPPNVLQNTNQVETPATVVENKSEIKPETINNTPTATSTPGKSSSTLLSNPELLTKSLDRSSYVQNFSEICGRRSIRSIDGYTPSKFQSNMSYRESYRRNMSELDVTTQSNTSLDVTVGSEAPNNSSFSLFGFGRKRERTSPTAKSTTDCISENQVSPPKRARRETFLSVVASPFSLIRSRFSKASIADKNSPRKQDELNDEDVRDVQNISGISIEENNMTSGELDADKVMDAVEKSPESDMENTVKKDLPDIDVIIVDEKCNAGTFEPSEEDASITDITVTETPLGGGLAESGAHNKRCNLM